MLAWLISHGEVDAALALGRSRRPLDQQLLETFDRGERERFWQLFGLLTGNEKLEFYLQVYFMIYSIHPSLGGQVALAKEDVDRFKRYLDSRGPQNAQHSDLTQFYALPYVKDPLKHDGYRTLFKKEWVSNLREKVVIYCREESNRLKQEALSFQRGGSTDEKELVGKLTHHLQRYRALEQQYKLVVEQANQTLMDTQNKWFGVTKDLVSSAKALVQMAGQNPRVTSERKFVNLRKKIERYEKFVNRKLEEMITQSQDISVFDRPSINELSYTMTQYTQKSRANGEMEITSLGVEDYVPTDYFRLKEDLATASDPELSITILKGLIWRLLKSKDVRVRRLNIIGVLMHDTFGLRTGDMRELFAHSTLRMYTVRLMFYIGHDYYGRCALFSTELIKDIIQLLKMHYRDEVLLSYGAPILQNLSVREDMKAEMIELDLVRFFLQLLNQHQEYLSSEILENIVATLLNLCSRPDGIRKFEQEPEALKILAGLLEGEWVTRAITIGAIFTLLGSKIMHEQALAVGLQEIISYMIEHNNRAHINDLRCLEERLLKFEPIKAPAKPPNNSDDVDEIEEDSMMDWQDELESIEEFIKAHEFISSEYQLSYREAQKQTEQVGQIYELTIQRIHEKREKERERLSQKHSSSAKSPVHKTKQNKENKAEMVSSEKKPFQSKNSAQKPSHVQNSQLHREADTAYFVLPPEGSHISEPVRSEVHPVRPREKLLKKLNEQIRASKLRPAADLSNKNSTNNVQAFSFKEQSSASQSVIANKLPLGNQKLKMGQPEELDIFAPKPKIARSPSNTPERQQFK